MFNGQCFNQLELGRQAGEKAAFPVAFFVFGLRLAVDNDAGAHAHAAAVMLLFGIVRLQLQGADGHVEAA